MVLFGAIPSGWGLFTIVAGLLGGFAFAPLAAYAATITEDKGQFAIVQRVIVLPLTLFSGTVFPLTQLPMFLQWIGWLSPLWHASELGRQFVLRAHRADLADGHPRRSTSAVWRCSAGSSACAT